MVALLVKGSMPEVLQISKSPQVVLLIGYDSLTMDTNYIPPPKAIGKQILFVRVRVCGQLAFQSQAAITT